MRREIVLVIHNVRSAHNVGSMLRTADGFGVKQVIISGFSPHPARIDDDRLPHIAQKIDRSIAKTSLGAEKSVDWSYIEDASKALHVLSGQGFLIAALEQTDEAVNLSAFKPPQKIALIVGNEVEGIDEQTIKMAAAHLMIPMLGSKESFNVSAAAAAALFHLRYS